MPGNGLEYAARVVRETRASAQRGIERSKHANDALSRSHGFIDDAALVRTAIQGMLKSLGLRLQDLRDTARVPTQQAARAIVTNAPLQAAPWHF